MVTRRTVDPSSGPSIQDSLAVEDVEVVDDLADRAGFDPAFLGVDVSLPSLLDPAVETVRLDYTHFTVLLRPDRRLAAVTGVGVDGATLLDLDRAGIDWRLDPRVPAEQQVGEEVYADNDLDRGHLVRRRDPVWGSPEQAALANADTFHYTNAAPQAGAFNQDEELWLGLEDYLLDNAATGSRRLVVFTGPVLAADDPLYRGVAIPLRFFKVAAFIDDGALAATGYVLDQSPQLEDLPGVPSPPGALVMPDAAGPPPLGAYRTYQVPVADVAALTGLDLEQLVAVDRLPVEQDVGEPGGAGGGAPEVTAGARGGVVPDAWRRLGDLGDVAWRRAR